MPTGWDKILRMLYGDNYMQPYPWRERKYRHGFYDVELSYQIHKAHFRGLFHPAPEAAQEIVLFGDGLLYEAYFEKYGNKYAPSTIVSLTDTLVEKQIHGVTVKTMGEFQQSMPNNIYPVICAIDVRRAQKKVQEAGIQNYYVFLKVREWILLANYTYALSELEK